MKMVDYLRPRLFEPLGIRKVFWESCPAGITKGGWGLFLCPEDAAKLGVMYVNGGKFEGKQIVPAEWVAASTSVHATPPEKMGKYGYGYQVWMEERPGSFAFNGMLGQNVLGYPDTGVVIVTNAGSNELFQTCEMLDIVRKYFGAEFGAELKSGEAESPMAYQKLVQTCRDLEGAKETPGRILRGGWKRRTPGPRNSGTPRQIDMAQLLHGKEYKMEDTHVGMFPLTLQVFHNNFSDGIRRIGFFYEKGRFFVELTEGEKTQRIEIGLTGSKVVEWVENEESYLLGTMGQFAENEDGELVLKLEFAFLEEAARRRVKIIFQRDFERIRLEWNETPGKDLIIEGLESLVTDVAIAPLLPSRFRERSLDMIHLLMAQTIEPMVEAHRVRPGEETETEEAAAEVESAAAVENAENAEETV